VISNWNEAKRLKHALQARWAYVSSWSLPLEAAGMTYAILISAKLHEVSFVPALCIAKGQLGVQILNLENFNVIA